MPPYRPATEQEANLLAVLADIKTALSAVTVEVDPASGIATAAKLVV